MEDLLFQCLSSPSNFHLSLFRRIAQCIISGTEQNVGQRLAVLALQEELREPLREMIKALAALSSEGLAGRLEVENALRTLAFDSIAHLTIEAEMPSLDALVGWAHMLEIIADAAPLVLHEFIHDLVQRFMEYSSKVSLLPLLPALLSCMRCVLLSAPTQLSASILSSLHSALSSLLAFAPTFAALMETKRLWLPRRAALCLTALEISQRGIHDEDIEESTGPSALSNRITNLENRFGSGDLDLAEQASFCHQLWALSGFIEAAAQDAVKPDAHRVGLDGAGNLLLKAYAHGPSTVRPALLPVAAFLLQSCLRLRVEAQTAELWQPLFEMLRGGLVGESRILRSRAAGALSWLLCELAAGTHRCALVQAVAALQPELLRTLRQAETPVLAREALLSLRSLGRLGRLHGTTALAGLVAATLGEASCSSSLAGAVVLETVARSPALLPERLANGLQEAASRLERRQLAGFEVGLWGPQNSLRFQALGRAFQILMEQEDDELPLAFIKELMIMMIGGNCGNIASTTLLRRGLLSSLAYGLLSHLCVSQPGALPLQAALKLAEVRKGNESPSGLDALRFLLAGRFQEAEAEEEKFGQCEVLLEAWPASSRQIAVREAQEEAQEAQEAQQQHLHEIESVPATTDLQEEPVVEELEARFNVSDKEKQGECISVGLFIAPDLIQEKPLQHLQEPARKYDETHQQQGPKTPALEGRNAPALVTDSATISRCSASRPASILPATFVACGQPKLRKRCAAMPQSSGSRCPGCEIRGAPWCLKRPGRFCCDGSSPAAPPAKRPRGLQAMLPQFQVLAESVRNAIELMKLQMSSAIEGALRSQLTGPLDGNLVHKDIETPVLRRARLGGC